MFRYFIYLAYDGTCYHGWQRQPNAVSVQEKMEEVLQLLFNRHVGVLGAGRTDTGVHARLMVAHIDSEKAIDMPDLKGHVIFDNVTFGYNTDKVILKNISYNKNC